MDHAETSIEIFISLKLLATFILCVSQFEEEKNAQVYKVTKKIVGENVKEYKTLQKYMNPNSSEFN